MIADANDILSVQGMLPYLKKELPHITCGDFSERIFIYDKLESTNITAREMITAGDGEHGSVVIADFQTAGKGRCGKSFYSPAGHGIYISFILDPLQLGFNTPTLITAFAAVAVCEAIEEVTGKTPQIKWVNDIFLDRRKVCGILTESVICPEEAIPKSIVLGIGINFSTPASAFPKELQNIAGSLFGEEKPVVTRNNLAVTLINRILFSKYHNNEDKMLKQYRKRMFLLGKIVFVEEPDGKYEATAVDIDDIGRLIVEKDNGELLMLSSGEVSIRNF